MTKIGLIDDHTLIRNAIKSLIDNIRGFKVIIDAINGRDFLEKIDPLNLPDIVLIDVNMPIMNGFETAEYLQNHYPNIKKIALTIENDETSILKMLRAGVVGYILKDSEPKYLKKAIEAVRDHGFFHDELVTKTLIASLKSEKVQETVEFIGRELEFIKWACTDLTYREIAVKMNIATRTVDGYRDNVFIKLEITSRVGLVLYAFKNGIVSY
jgi:two-component system, NarL family, invasion response regulator UvrY